MQRNLTDPGAFLSWLNDLRAKVSALAGNVFSPPYLPAGFTVFLLVTSLTQWAVILMNQPLNYLRGDLNGAGMAHSGFALDYPFIAWIAFGAVYFSLAILCLTVFNYRWSLIGWLAAEVIHFYGMHNWLEDCAFSRWSVPLGGFCQSFDGRMYWIAVGLVVGLFTYSALRPTPSALKGRQVRSRTARLPYFAAAAWTSVLIVGIIASLEGPGADGWMPVDVEYSPGPLFEAEAAYDSMREAVLVFGGLSGRLEGGQWGFKNDTWLWDGQEWRAMHSTRAPSGRAKHAMAYDENRGVVVMFGGYGGSGPLEDTWEWNGSEWVSLCTCDHPSARYGHEMFYDPAREKVVLYGGWDGTTEYNDAWEWDGEACNWNKIELGQDAPRASYFSILYRPDRQGLFAWLSPWPGGTWSLEGDRWTQLSLSVAPKDRWRTTAVYDPNLRSFIAFGGDAEDGALNDTWLFDGQRWSQHKDRIRPSVRYDMLIWYDPFRERVMLYGGYNGNTVFDDMWEFIAPQQ